MLHTLKKFLQKQVIPRVSDLCLFVFDLTKKSIHVSATWIAEKTKEKRV